MADFCKQCAEDLGFPRSDFEDPKLLKAQVLNQCE